MNFSHYLPDTEERIERLRLLINKRPVAILLPGGSIAELESRIEELQGLDICYFGLNSYRPLETDILEKIGQQFSVIMNSADPIKLIDSVVHFLSRQNGNVLISEETSFAAERVDDALITEEGINNLFISEKTSFSTSSFDYKGFFERHDKKLLFFIAVPYYPPWRIPNTDYPLHFPAQCSFSILLALAAIGQASSIFVFGGDGGRIENAELYFHGIPQSKEGCLVHDAIWFNESMLQIMDRVYNLYELSPVDIFNCSIQSHYTVFPRISCDEAVARLKGEYIGDNTAA